jgi:hypothetical protein
MTPALNDVSRLGNRRDIHAFTFFHAQNIIMLLPNGIVVDVVALLLMTGFSITLGIDKVALGARMDMLQMSFLLIVSMFREYKVLTDQNQQPREIGNANNRVTLLTKEALTWRLSTLLAIIWLLRDVSDLALDWLSTHPVEDLSGLFRRIVHDAKRSTICSKRLLICA